MQIEVRFRRRAMVGESLSLLNYKLLDRLSTISKLWAADVAYAHYDAGSGESAAADLSPCLVNGIKATVSYASRLPAAVADKAISDDVMALRFDREQVDFEEFCREVFPAIVTAFEPYRASVVIDLDQDLDDYEDIVREAQRTGRDIDGRDTVFRLHLVNYFDRIMCERAFGGSPEKIADELCGLVPLVRIFQDGVLIVRSYEPSQSLSDLDAEIRARLSH